MPSNASRFWAPPQPWPVRKAELRARVTRRHARNAVTVAVLNALPFVADTRPAGRIGLFALVLLADFGLVKFADYAALRHRDVDALVASDAWHEAIRCAGLTPAAPIAVPADLRAPEEAAPRTVGTWRGEFLGRDMEFSVYGSTVGPSWVLSGALMHVGGNAEPMDFEWCPAGKWHDVAAPSDDEIDAWAELAVEGIAYRIEGAWLAAAAPNVTPALVRPLLLALYDCATQRSLI